MNRPELILLVGIPGSGKTTYSKEYIERSPNTFHLSSDAIRKELYGDENIQGNPGEVFALMQKRAVEALNNGYDVIATRDTHYENYLETQEGVKLPVKHCLKGSEGHKLYGKINDLVTKKDKKN